MKLHAQADALVVEDDDGIRTLVGAVLEGLGLRVQAVTNGAEGVAAAQSVAPAVITMDIRMPGMDGFEATRRIREFSDALIVMLSAHVADADEFESLRAGADVYMRKPFRPRELRAVIAAHLKARDRA